MKRLRWLSFAAGAYLQASLAHADAVPPPPERCPKGQVGVTDHGGPKCVPEAPKNCAPGYRGQVGGQCVLAHCSTNEQCEGDQRCVRIETCQEFRTLHWTGWGWSAQRPVLRDNFLAGPPRPQPEGPPKQAWVELNICGQDGACKSPAECRPSSLCYPTGAIGKTKAKILANQVDTPPSTSPEATTTTPPPEPGSAGAPAADPTSPPAGTSGAPGQDEQSSMPEGGGGCRKGCTASPGASFLGGSGLPLLATALLLRRRRRRHIN